MHHRGSSLLLGLRVLVKTVLQRVRPFLIWLKMSTSVDIFRICRHWECVSLQMKHTMWCVLVGTKNAVSGGVDLR